MRHGFRFDCSRVNLSLLETTKGELSEPWAGPLVVYCRNGLSMDSNKVDRNITLSDFRSFLDICKVYGAGSGSMLKGNMLFELEITNANLFWSVIHRNSGGTAAKGVEVSCKGDMTVLGLRKYRDTNVAVNHPIWDAIRPHGGLRNDWGSSSSSQNLPRCSFRWKRPWPRCGMPDSGYTGRYGTGKMFGRVLVVREDMKDIKPKQIEAIVNFFSQDASPKINKEKNERLSKLSGEEARIEQNKMMAELVSRSKFERFFEKFKIEKIKGGYTSWAGETVPEATDGDSDDDSWTRVARQLDNGGWL
ncbi:hypothetical protein DL98DRAFT_637040 [Cadophora sp. DSE1049]|nr:hypothetical protein DL98DRAFT_637040 [Cadophora sp. DSE1049]